MATFHGKASDIENINNKIASTISHDDTEKDKKYPSEQAILDFFAKEKATNEYIVVRDPETGGFKNSGSTALGLKNTGEWILEALRVPDLGHYIPDGNIPIAKEQEVDRKTVVDSGVNINDVVKHNDFTPDDFHLIPTIEMVDDGEGNYTPKLVSSDLNIENIATQRDLGEAVKGVAKLDRTNLDGIVTSSIVIGSRCGDGTLMDSGVSVDYIMTRLPFQGEHDGEIVYVKAGANENSVLPSGVKIDDIALKEDLVEYPSLIASGTTTEDVEAIEITTDKDGNPFALRNWITIYIEVPAASASSNVQVLLNNANAAFSLNGIATTKKIVRTSLRWNGRLWESYTVASGEASNTQVNSIPKYWVSTKNPTKINLVGSFPVGTYFCVYSYRA